MVRFLLSIGALVSFIAFTVMVSATGGERFLTYAAGISWNSWGAQVGVDLYIACTIACIWIWHDARRQGWGLGMVVPFYVVTLPFASMGLLLYFTVRNFRLMRLG